MNFPEDKLKEIENYAANFFTPKEICLLINADYKKFIELLQNEKSAVYKSYNRGRLLSENEIRTEIINNAKMGSPAAQIESLKFISKQKTDLIFNA